MLWPWENLIPAEDWVGGTGALLPLPPVQPWVPPPLLPQCAATPPRMGGEKDIQLLSCLQGRGKGFREEDEWGWMLNRALE